ncbi:MAG: TerD family protein [bacterium]|nr:TerD family protein [bacterium]
MSISLKKGEKIDLRKSDGAGLTRIMVGLGWDPAKPGLARSLLGIVTLGIMGSNVDCDATAMLCVNGKLVDQSADIVYFGHLEHKSGAVQHMGDNLTGDGDGDDEQIMVDLTKLPEKYDKIIFVVNIFLAKLRFQHFGMIQNAFIRICDEKDQEFCRYDLSGKEYNGMTSLIFGEVYRQDGVWKFNAIGKATTDGGLGSLAEKFK